ncbi:MAG TPA: hypothetical protein VIY49_11985 [Bryobacteraceae bacterium]
MNTLQQLQESNPTQYQQVTQQIATSLQNAAQTVTADGNTTAASQLNQLATDFTNASQSGQLPNISSLGNSRIGTNVASSTPAPAFSGTPSAPTAQVYPSRAGLSPLSSASNILAEQQGSMLHQNSAPAAGSASNPNATTSVTPNSSSTAIPNSDTQTLDTGGAVNPYVPPAQQTAAAPDGYQYVPFGTGTSVVPTMANWLSGWQQANSNLSPSAQQNQILNYGAGQGTPMYGANLPGTNIPWASLTQEQQAAYVQATSTGQSISNIQQFLNQYEGPNTPGNESYDEAMGSSA